MRQNWKGKQEYKKEKTKKKTEVKVKLPKLEILQFKKTIMT